MRLGAELRIELCWWWQAPPAGEPVRVGDPLSARLHLAHLAARWPMIAELRRFLREGSPSSGAPLDDADVLELVANALATGRARLAVRTADPLSVRDRQPDEEATGSRVVRPAAEAPPEEVCWPCRERAAASARALREACAAGLPFVLDG